MTTKRKNKKDKKDKRVAFNSRVTVHKIDAHNASEFNEKLKGNKR